MWYLILGTCKLLKLLKMQFKSITVCNVGCQWKKGHILNKCFKLSTVFKLNFIFYCYNYSLQYVKLYVRAPAPRLESAWFNKMYCSLTLMFDASVEGPENCRQLFDEASYQKLGHSKNY